MVLAKTIYIFKSAIEEVAKVVSAKAKVAKQRPKIDLTRISNQLDLVYLLLKI